MNRSRTRWSWCVACIVACGSTGPEVEARRDASSDAQLSIDASHGSDSGAVDAAGDAARLIDAGTLIDANTRDAITPDAALMRVACDGPDAVLPDAPVVAPDRLTYLADIANVPSMGSNPPTAFTVDPNDCQALLWDIYLPLGSAFVHVIPNRDGSCAVWLGGEEENPEYNGMPQTYCRLPSMCTPVSFVFDENGSAGPARLDSPWCTWTGFCTNDFCTE